MSQVAFGRCTDESGDSKCNVQVIHEELREHRSATIN